MIKPLWRSQDESFIIEDTAEASHKSAFKMHHRDRFGIREFKHDDSFEVWSLASFSSVCDTHFQIHHQRYVSADRVVLSPEIRLCRQGGLASFSSVCDTHFQIHHQRYVSADVLCEWHQPGLQKPKLRDTDRHPPYRVPARKSFKVP